MLAIDTNILVRFIVGDHAGQTAKARTLFETQPIFVPLTVWLETEWVLRHAYRFDADSIVTSFVAVLGLPRVTAEESARVVRALDWTKSGLDFADALHLAGSDGCAGFATFDLALAKRAKALSDLDVQVP